METGSLIGHCPFEARKPSHCLHFPVSKNRKFLSFVREWDANAAKCSLFPTSEQSFETFGYLALLPVFDHRINVPGDGDGRMSQAFGNHFERNAVIEQGRGAGMTGHF
jgi:hypothetical protein